MLYDSLAQLETLGVCRRGYFVEGLGGAQFALPGAVERLRSQKADEETPPIVLAATDPAQPYGAALPWPKREDDRKRPQRVAGAYVVLAGAEPVLYVERGGKGIVTSSSSPTTRACARALEALAAFVTGGRGRTPRDRARRRRAGRRLAVGGRARRARLPRRAPQAHAERVIAPSTTCRWPLRPACEAAARRFYGALLGLEELAKPERLRARGGVWFRCGHQQLHVGVEEPFAPAAKAHPGLRVARARSSRSSRPASRPPAPRRLGGHDARFHADDPCGNRLELLAPGRLGTFSPARCATTSARGRPRCCSRAGARRCSATARSTGPPSCPPSSPRRAGSASAWRPGPVVADDRRARHRRRAARGRRRRRCARRGGRRRRPRRALPGAARADHQRQPPGAAALPAPRLRRSPRCSRAPSRPPARTSPRSRCAATRASRSATSSSSNGLAMPEGDTIHYAANRIRPVLAGASPTSSRRPTRASPHDRWPERLAGRAVEAVDAHGKHLFIRFEGDLVIHSHLRMTGSWGVYRDGQRWRRSPRRAWLVIRNRGHAVVQFDGPVLELMTESRTRFDQRLAALGPDILAPEFDERPLPAPPARGRPDAPDRRRAARPAHDRGHRQPVEGRGLLRRRDRPVAPDRRGHRRGGAADRAPDAAAHAAVRARRQPERRPHDLQPPRHALPALRRADPAARPVGRQPPDILVPGMPALKRVGHKGADLIAPGNTLASFDAALAAGVDMVEFDVLPEHRDGSGRLVLAHDYSAADRRDALTLERGPRALRSRRLRRRRARRRPQARRLRAARRRRAARARAGRAHAHLDDGGARACGRCARSRRRSASAGRCRSCAATRSPTR